MYTLGKLPTHKRPKKSLNNLTPLQYTKIELNMFMWVGWCFLQFKLVM